MRTLLVALLVMAGIGAEAANFVTVTNTFTNRTVVGDSFTVNGTTVRFTNAPLNNTAWLPTNSAAASATNVQRWFGRVLPSIYARLLNATNTALSGTDLSYAISGGFGYLITNSAGTTNQNVIEYPWQNLPTAKKTNQADALIEGIGLYGWTNAFPANAQALTNFVGRTNAQTLTRKTLTTPTITGPTVSALTNWGGILSNMTAIQVTNLDAQAAQIAGGSVSNIYILNALAMRGVITALSNGTLHNVSVTNSPMLHGTNITGFGGYLSNMIVHSLIVTNFDAPGTGAGSLVIGENTSAIGQYAIAIGDESEATNAQSLALGYDASSTGIAGLAIGSGSSAAGPYSVAIGNDAVGLYHSSVAIGFSAQANHSNSIAIGFTAETTTTNEIVLGSASDRVSIPGQLWNVTQTNSTLRGTNILNGDLSFTRYDVSTIANGNNIGVIFGTNYNINLSGSVTAIPTLCGVAGGRNGLKYEVFNSLGYSIVITETTSDPTAANRFDLADGADVIIPNGGSFTMIYNSATSRWNLRSAYPNTITASYVNMFTSNAVSWNVSSGYGAISNMHHGPMSGFTSDFTSGSVTNLYAGTFRVNLSVSYSEAAGSALLEYAFLTNGVECANIHAFRDVSSTAYGVVGSGGIIDVPANTKMQIAIQYVTGSGGGTVTNANFTVTRLE